MNQLMMGNACRWAASPKVAMVPTSRSFGNYRSQAARKLLACALLELGACGLAPTAMGSPSPGSTIVSLPYFTLSVPAGTDIALDELATRGYEAATVTLRDGQSWELTWTMGSWTDAFNEMRGRGIDLALDDGGFSARAGMDGSEFCVLSTGSGGATLFFTREATDQPCTKLSDVRDELPSIALAKSGDGQHLAKASSPWGTSVGSYKGVSAYSNGSTSYVYSCSAGDARCKYGIPYQCVEFVVRFYATAMSWRNMNGSGNAKTYCSNTAKTGLRVFKNGGTSKPAINDILVSTAGPAGHVGIVREVGRDYVKVVMQNWSNTSSDNSKTLAMNVSGGKYSVAGFSSTYTVACWARK